MHYAYAVVVFRLKWIFLRNHITYTLHIQVNECNRDGAWAHDNCSHSYMPIQVFSREKKLHFFRLNYRIAHVFFPLLLKWCPCVSAQARSKFVEWASALDSNSFLTFCLFILSSSLYTLFLCEMCERETFQSAIIGKRSQRKLLIHFIQLFVAVVVPHLHSHFHSYSSIVFCYIYSLRIRSFFLNYFWCFVCWCWCCDFNVLAHFFFTWNEIYTSVSLYIQVCTPISLVVNEQQFFNDTSFRVPFTEKKFGSRKNDTFEMSWIQSSREGAERE